MSPKYDLDKIKYATDEGTFERAIGLYEKNKITNFEQTPSGYFAIVIGTHPYRVFVSDRHFDQGDCECYLGQNNTLCKHMVAVAIYALKQGKALLGSDKIQHNEIIFSSRKGELAKNELSQIKKTITSAMRYIKPYNGPSKIWFAYQSSLEEGCNRLAAIFSTLPVSRQTSDLVIKTLIKLDDRLTIGGVDDSDGTVGGFIEQSVDLLLEFIKLDPTCMKSIELLKGKPNNFGWEDRLWELIDNQ